MPEKAHRNRPSCAQGAAIGSALSRPPGTSCDPLAKIAVQPYHSESANADREDAKRPSRADSSNQEMQILTTKLQAASQTALPFQEATDEESLIGSLNGLEHARL